MNETYEKEVEKLNIFLGYAKHYLGDNVLDDVDDVVDQLYEKDNYVTIELAQEIEMVTSKLKDLKKS